jgi:hypothetical protein
MSGSHSREIPIGPNIFPYSNVLPLAVFLPRILPLGSQMQVPQQNRHYLPWEDHELVEIGQSSFLPVGAGNRLHTSTQLERAPELLFIRYAAV